VTLIGTNWFNLTCCAQDMLLLGEIGMVVAENSGVWQFASDLISQELRYKRSFATWFLDCSFWRSEVTTCDYHFDVGTFRCVVESINYKVCLDDVVYICLWHVVACLLESVTTCFACCYESTGHNMDTTQRFNHGNYHHPCGRGNSFSQPPKGIC